MHKLKCAVLIPRGCRFECEHKSKPSFQSECLVSSGLKFRSLLGHQCHATVYIVMLSVISISILKIWRASLLFLLVLMSGRGRLLLSHPPAQWEMLPVMVYLPLEVLPQLLYQGEGKKHLRVSGAFTQQIPKVFPAADQQEKETLSSPQHDVFYESENSWSA